MNAPLNQRPSDLRREQLPAWTLEALDAAERASHAGEGFRPRGDLSSWYVPERGLALWSRPSGRGLLLVAAALLVLGGFGLLLWALLALRTDRILTAIWVIGGALAGVGAVSTSLVWRWLGVPRLDGLLITKDGLIVKDGAHHRIAARAEIHEVTFDDGRLTIVYGPERRSWRQYSARVGTPAHAALERRRRALVEWRKTGALPAPEGPREPHHAPRRASGLALKILVIIAILLGFLWLTLVMPARSEAGRLARAFVAHVGAKEYDAAYAMLSAKRRSSLSRERFEVNLSPKLRSASGFTVNSISTGVGTVAGSDTCVDGWLDGVSGFSGYVFDFVIEGERLRIEGYHEGQCRKD